MLSFLASVAVRSGVDYLFIAAFVCSLTAAELIAPKETLPPLRDRLRVIAFLFAYLPLATISVRLIWRAIEGLDVPHPLIVVHGLTGMLMGALVTDFFYYWYHRAQHAVPWLWRIHAMHHSAEKMGAGAGFHHLLDAPLKGLLVSLPAGLLFGGDAAGAAASIFTLHGFYVHSTTRANFGPVAWMICDNRVHRVHHSRDSAHYNRNFGVITLIWDRLFGTAYFPKPGEWPDVGLDDMREPKTIGAWLRLPDLRGGSGDRETLEQVDVGEPARSAVN